MQSIAGEALQQLAVNDWFEQVGVGVGKGWKRPWEIWGNMGKFSKILGYGNVFTGRFLLG